MTRPPVLIAVLLFLSLLAGCIGGDDALDIEDQDNDDLSGDTGSLKGKVLTVDLRELPGARVALIADGELVKEGTTDENGNYVLRGIEPGQYRLQVSAVCCREHVRAVNIEAGKEAVADIQLEPFTDADLQTPFMEPYEWNGFLSCALGSPALVIALCSAAEDPNDDFIHFFDIQYGVRTIVLGMEWDAAGGVLGNELQIILENEGCGLGSCSHEYGRAEGTSPLFVLANGPDSGDWAFSEIDPGDTRPLQIRVFPAFSANLYYQQPFTVHYHVFYHAQAPEGYDPLPDS